MKKTIHNLFVLFLILLSLGSVTDGLISSLFAAPKPTQGIIKNGIYSSIIADTTHNFRIAIPQYSSKYEYSYLRIKEERDNGMTYVSFGPAALNTNIYRVMVVKKLENKTPLRTRALNVINHINTMLINGFNAKNNPLVFKNTSFHGYHAIMAVTEYSAKNNGNPSAFINITYVVEYPAFYVVFSADLSDLHSVTPQLKTSAIKGNETSMMKFMNSFGL